MFVRLCWNDARKGLRGETCLRKVLMWELRRYLVVLKTGVSPQKKRQNAASIQTSRSYHRLCYEVIHNPFLDTICHFHLSSPPTTHLLLFFFFCHSLLSPSALNPPPRFARLSVWVHFLCHRLQDVLYKHARFQSQRKKACETETSRSSGKQPCVGLTELPERQWRGTALTKPPVFATQPTVSKMQRLTLSYMFFQSLRNLRIAEDHCCFFFS